VLPDASQDTLTPWVRTLVAPGAIVHTDGWPGYGKLAGAGYDHRPRLQRRDSTADEALHQVREEKPPTEFSGDRSRKDGRYPRCKACLRRWQQEQAEYMADYHRR
jgi:ISXO2 transposase-like protein